MDFEAIAKNVIGIVVSTNQAAIDAAIDDAAAKIVSAVKDSGTTLDDAVVKSLFAPALRRLATKVEEGLV